MKQDVQDLVEEKIEEWENLPEMGCNHCGATFRGSHDCDYEYLKRQNKQYHEVMKSSLSEIKYALYSNKTKDVKNHYLKNAERYLTEALENKHQ